MACTKFLKSYVGQSMSRQEQYEEAIEEIMDVPGLSKLQGIMKKYNLSFVTIDYKLQITVKRSKDYCPKKDEKKLDLEKEKV